MCRDEAACDCRFGREGMLLPILWANVQHNENTRNRFFQFYLIIAGSFLVFFEKNGGEAKGALVFSAFVWIVGCSFLWTYERFREMVARDVAMIRQIMELLRDGTMVERQLFNKFNLYYERLATTSNSWWSPTSSISSSTNLIGSLVLSLEISQQLSLVWWQATLSGALLVLLTWSAIKVLNKAVKFQVRRSGLGGGG